MKKRLPEELLSLTLEKLEPSDLIQCQQVCHAWYSPARVTLLQEVQLSSATVIQQFIESIDLNPESVYLNAVKKISIGSPKYGSPEIYYLFDQETIEKLFLRFPNLKEVRISATTSNSFEAFNDEICESFWECCPKLEAFEVDTGKWKVSGPYFDVLYKLRMLLTKMNIQKFDRTSSYESTEQFIENFPRVTKIYSQYEKLSYRRLLPVINKLPHLTSIHSEMSGVFEPKFCERYQENMSTSEKAQFERRLANITNIHHLFLDGFCSNSIKFVSKYLTNLKTISLNGYTPDWDPETSSFFANDILKVGNSAKDTGYVSACMPRTSLPREFPRLRHNIYKSIPLAFRKTAIKSLTFVIEDYINPRDETHFSIKSIQQPFTRNIELRITQDALTALDILLNVTPVPEINVFTVRIKQMTFIEETRYDFEPLVKKFEQVITKLPSIKKLDMELPTTYVEVETVHYNYDQVYFGLVHPQVNELTIRAAPDLDIQSLLNRYSFTFPNLTSLSLYYFGGVWKAESSEFRVMLQGYSLDKLELDMTPVKNKTIEFLATQSSATQPFFVIELETLNNGERQLFKVSLDLSSITRIIDSGIKGFVRGRDYFKALVNINSLDHLELCMDDSGKEEDRLYFAEKEKTITRAVVPL